MGTKGGAQLQPLNPPPPPSNGQNVRSQFGAEGARWKCCRRSSMAFSEGKGGKKECKENIAVTVERVGVDKASNKGACITHVRVFTDGTNPALSGLFI